MPTETATTEIATVQTAIYEVTGQPRPAVLYDLCKFDVLSTHCHVRTNHEGDTLYLRVGHREFAVSILDLAARATIEIEGRLKSEIRDRILAQNHPAPMASIPVRGTVGPDGRITPVA